MTVSGQTPDTVRHPDDRGDRRVARTRQAIDRAFLDVLQRRGYDALSVSDVVREANIGRATFYEHYPSKDEVLRAQLRRVLASSVRADAARPGGVDASALFAHVRDVRMLYRLIAGRSATARSMRVLREALEERAVELLHADAIPPSAAARVWAAMLCALLSWWTEQGLAASVEEMQAMFATCAAPLFSEGPTA